MPDGGPAAVVMVRDPQERLKRLLAAKGIRLGGGAGEPGPASSTTKGEAGAPGTIDTLLRQRVRATWKTRRSSSTSSARMSRP